MSYAPYLMIGLLMLMAVAGSSRFVQLVSVEERMARRREEEEILSHRLQRLISEGRSAEAENLYRRAWQSHTKANPAPARRTRYIRLAHAALLLLVVFWPASPSQAPVRNAAPAVEAGHDATPERPRPCYYVKVAPAPAHKTC